MLTYHQQVALATLVVAVTTIYILVRKYRECKALGTLGGVKPSVIVGPCVSIKVYNDESYRQQYNIYVSNSMTVPVSHKVLNDKLVFQKVTGYDGADIPVNYVHSNYDHNEIIHVNTPTLFDSIFTQYNIPKTAFPVKFPFYIKVSQITGDVYHCGVKKTAYNSIYDLIYNEYWNAWRCILFICSIFACIYAISRC